MTDKIKITYFDVRGKVELTRFILKANNVEFEDERIKFEDWPALKPKTPAGQLPIVRLPCGKILIESMAISRYFAKQYNLIGATDFENYIIDRAIYTLQDIFDKYVAIFHEANEQNKEKMKSEFRKNNLPKYLTILNNYLKEEGGPFFLGKKPSFADLQLLNVLDNAEESELKCYQEIVVCRQELLKHYPALKTYRETRPKTPI